jgi:hypothetical protein
VADFVNDYLDPVETKLDEKPIPAGASTAKYIRATDINKLSDATVSLRTAVINARGLLAESGNVSATYTPAVNGTCSLAVTLTSTTTAIAAPSGTGTSLASIGQQVVVTFVITQDSTGGRNVTWANVFTGVSNFMPRQGPGQRSSISFLARADGSFSQVGFDGIDTSEWLNVKDWGAVGSGAVNDVAAINACLAYARSVSVFAGTVVRMPKGVYLISGTSILMAESSGIELRGDGVESTRIEPSSLTGLPIINLRNCQNCGVVGMSIRGKTSQLPSVGVEIRRESGHTAGYGSTKNYVYDVALGGAPSQAMGKGISISGDLDANNDFHRFVRVYSDAATLADIAIDPTQSVGNSILDCFLNSTNVIGNYGVWVGATPDRAADFTARSSTKGGAFWMKGGATGSHGVSDFYFSGAGPGQNTIQDVNSESSAAFINTSSVPGAVLPLLVESCRYSSDSSQINASLAITYLWGGPLIIRNCRFDQTDVTKFAGISFSSGVASEYDISGNIFNQPGAAALSMITKTSVAGGTFIGREGNMYLDGASAWAWKGNEARVGTKTWDPANVADGAFTSTTVTVTGAAVGDVVSVGFSVAVPAGAILSGAITAADTATVTLFNKTGGAVDLASGTLKVTATKA